MLELSQYDEVGELGQAPRSAAEALRLYAKTPAAVIAHLKGEVDAILKMPDVQKRFIELGADAGTLSGDGFGTFLAEETTKWGRIIKASGATIE